MKETISLKICYKFIPPNVFPKNHQHAMGLNRIINMSFTWFNINANYNNQLIKFSKDNGVTFQHIEFSGGV